MEILENATFQTSSTVTITVDRLTELNYAEAKCNILKNAYLQSTYFEDMESTVRAVFGEKPECESC